MASKLIPREEVPAQTQETFVKRYLAQRVVQDESACVLNVELSQDFRLWLRQNYPAYRFGVVDSRECMEESDIYKDWGLRRQDRAKVTQALLESVSLRLMRAPESASTSVTWGLRWRTQSEELI